MLQSEDTTAESWDSGTPCMTILQFRPGLVLSNKKQPTKFEGGCVDAWPFWQFWDQTK
jgi:hypothetical protein